MTPKALREWFARAGWKTLSYERGEIQAECPKCKYHNFFFNVQKLVGYCHKAKCPYHLIPPSFEDLVELAGFGPDEFGGYRLDRAGVDEDDSARILKPDVMPGELVCYREGGTLLTKYPGVLEWLQNRRVSVQDVIRFKMTFDGERVYVPVYKGEELINYVGRDLTGMASRKYKYFKGAKTSEWLFGWDECQNWNKLTLVENTFVSISMRNDCQCTTNFGSHLSDTQIDLIKKSKVQSVALLWDQGAHYAASKAVENLHKAGVKGAYVYMAGQPDDHDPTLIKQIAAECHVAAWERVPYIDPFKIRQKLMADDAKKFRAMQNERRRGV